MINHDLLYQIYCLNISYFNFPSGSSTELRSVDYQIYFIFVVVLFLDTLHLPRGEVCPRRFCV